MCSISLMLQTCLLAKSDEAITTEHHPPDSQITLQISVLAVSPLRHLESDLNTPALAFTITNNSQKPIYVSPVLAWGSGVEIVMPNGEKAHETIYADAAPTAIQPLESKVLYKESVPVLFRAFALRPTCGPYRIFWQVGLVKSNDVFVLVEKNQSPQTTAKNKIITSKSPANGLKIVLLDEAPQTKLVPLSPSIMDR